MQIDLYGVRNLLFYWLESLTIDIEIIADCYLVILGLKSLKYLSY